MINVIVSAVELTATECSLLRFVCVFAAPNCFACLLKLIWCWIEQTLETTHKENLEKKTLVDCGLRRDSGACGEQELAFKKLSSAFHQRGLAPR